MKNLDKMRFHYQKLFFEKLKEANLEANKYAIAGGALRDYLSGAEVKDIDLFCQDQEAQDKLCAWFKNLAETTDDAKILNENDMLLNVILDGKWFQVIKGKFFNMETDDLIRSFDYTICGIMQVDGDVRTLPTFYQDALAKHLRINVITFPLSTLERMQKYIQKGYEACNGTLLAVAQATATVDFENPNQDTLRFYPDGTPRFFGMD